MWLREELRTFAADSSAAMGLADDFCNKIGQKAPLGGYSSTSSAVASSNGAIVTLSALAVFKLIVSLNLVGV